MARLLHHVCAIGLLALVAAPAHGAEEAEMTSWIGTARDAKGGAILLVDDAPVYVKGLDAWPEGVEGATVRLTGTLVDQALLPEAQKGPDGGWSQGTAPGTQQQVATGPTWAPLGYRAPWSVRFDDGSHNVTEVGQEAIGSPITWAYLPTTAERSSSGTYDGGTPAKGTCSEAHAFALWQLVHPVAPPGGAAPEGGRPMGTGVIRISEGGTETWARLSMADAQALGKRLAEWREAAQP